jgi:hypothetical protein
MADVNGDGALDIYVSAVNYLTMAGRNVLYINDGTGTFTDRTEEYGLHFSGFSTQALFFDYDGDGDLDCTCSITRCTPSGRSAPPHGEIDGIRRPVIGCIATTASASPT